MEKGTTGMVNWGAGVIVAAVVALAAATYQVAAAEPDPVMLDMQGVPVTVEDVRRDDPGPAAPTFEPYVFDEPETFEQPAGEDEPVAEPEPTSTATVKPAGDDPEPSGTNEGTDDPPPADEDDGPTHPLLQRGDPNYELDSQTDEYDYTEDREARGESSSEPDGSAD